jgi:hypothetical protein
MRSAIMAIANNPFICTNYKRSGINAVLTVLKENMVFTSIMPESIDLLCFVSIV